GEHRVHGGSLRLSERGGSGRGSGEDVLLVATVGFEPGEPLPGGLVVTSGAGAVYAGEGVAHGGCHAPSIAADVDVRTSPERLPHGVGGGGDGVLHVAGRVVGDSGEGRVDAGDAGPLPALQLVAVEVVVFR